MKRRAPLDSMMQGRKPILRVVAVEPTVVVARRSTEVIAQDDPAVAKALRFIKDHAGRAIDVPQVARETGISRRTLERRFAEATGHSILAEITRCRLDRTKRLLLETGHADLPGCRSVGLQQHQDVHSLFSAGRGTIGDNLSRPVACADAQASQYAKHPEVR
ncbi:MAG: AraC family transcriptional regulator [Rhizomicrobium sp.]